VPACPPARLPSISSFLPRCALCLTRSFGPIRGRDRTARPPAIRCNSSGGSSDGGCSSGGGGGSGGGGSGGGGSGGGGGSSLPSPSARPRKRPLPHGRVATCCSSSSSSSASSSGSTQFRGRQKLGSQQWLIPLDALSPGRLSGPRAPARHRSTVPCGPLRGGVTVPRVRARGDWIQRAHGALGRGCALCVVCCGCW
jgi:hypothetical protein